MRLFLLLALCFLSFQASAGPIVFSRKPLYIESIVTPAPVQGADKKEKDAQQPAVPPQKVRHEFSAEVRAAEQEHENWLARLATLQEKEVLLSPGFDPEALAQEWSGIKTPADVVFIAKGGKILAILPTFTPATLSDPLTLKAEAEAVLYLAPGTAEKMGIKPGDTVTHPIFTPSTVILQ